MTSNKEMTLLGQMSAALERDLASIPAKHNRALIAVVDDEGARVGVAARVGDHWELSGEVEKRWKKRRVGRKVVIRGSW